METLSQYMIYIQFELQMMCGRIMTFRDVILRHDEQGYQGGSLKCCYLQ